MNNGLFFGILLQLILPLASVMGQTGGFAYQGRLLEGTEPANGSYDLQFRLADDATNGNYVGDTVTKPEVDVTNGVFRVLLDFTAAVFDGSGRWLEIGVRTNGSEESYTILVPRQAITATPYAAFATTAANLPPGTAVALNGAAITNLDGGNLQPGTVTSNALDRPTRTQLALASSGGAGFTNAADAIFGSVTATGAGVFTSGVLNGNEGDFNYGFVTGPWVAGSFIGDGGGIANLNGANLRPGSVPGTALDATVQGQLALAASGGGLSSGASVTNITIVGSLTFGTGTNAITLTPTNVSAGPLISDWSQLYVTGSASSQVNGTYTLQCTNATTGEAAWTNSTGDYLVRQNAINVLVDVETIPDGQWLYLQSTTLSATPQLVPAYSAGDFGCYVSTATNPAPYNTMPAFLLSSLIRPNPISPAWIVDTATGDDAHASRGFIPYKTLGAAIANASAGDIIYVRKGVYSNEASTVHVPVPNLSIIGEGAGTIFSNADFAPVLYVNDGLYLSHLNFYRWLFEGGATNLTFEHINVTGPDTSDVVVMEGIIDGVRFYDCEFLSAWDTVVFNNTGPPGTADLWNCKQSTIGWLDHGGMHPVNIGGNMTVKLHGGEINLTNYAELPEDTYNSCVMMPKAGGIGTNTLALYGTALNFSDVSGTNAFAIVTRDTNQIIQGWFMANGVLNTMGSIVTNFVPTPKP